MKSQHKNQNQQDYQKKKQQEKESALPVADYSSSFLNHTGFMVRNGKSVYIDPDFHEKLSRIAFIVGEGKVNISDYLHNILKHHFQQFAGEITASFNEKYKPI